MEDEGLKVTRDRVRYREVFTGGPVRARSPDQKDPRTGLAGKFSIAYCVANALLRGDTGMQAFTDEKVNYPEIREFMGKISVLLDEKMVAMEADVAGEDDGREGLFRLLRCLPGSPGFGGKEGEDQGQVRGSVRPGPGGPENRADPRRHTSLSTSSKTSSLSLFNTRFMIATARGRTEVIRLATLFLHPGPYAAPAHAMLSDMNQL